jgi:hypothetical protein
MSLFSKKPIEAKLVGSNLVAAFHRANPPLIWKFDLDRNHSFTVALQGEEGDWELGITSPKGEFYPIVHFVMHEHAEEALSAVQKILMKKRRSKIWMAIKFLFFVLVIVGLMGAGGLYVFKALRMPSMDNFVSSPSATPVSPPSGVPVPADEVLRLPH